MKNKHQIYLRLNTMKPRTSGKLNSYKLVLNFTKEDKIYVCTLTYLYVLAVQIYPASIVYCIFFLYDAKIKVSEASLHNFKYCKTHVEIPQNPHLLNHRYTCLILNLQNTKAQ